MGARHSNASVFALIETKESADVKISPRQWFVAALALYLLWVVGLAALAFTSSTRPAARMTQPNAERESKVPSPTRSL